MNCKRLFLGFVLIHSFVVFSGFSQTIKLNTGVSMSSINHDFFCNNLFSFSFTSEYDYLNKSFFFVSSELGYIGKGAKNSKNNMKMSWGYLHLNTCFNPYFNYKDCKIYFGIGPKVDIKISENEIGSNDLELKKMTPGAILTVGFIEKVATKINIGIKSSYLFNFSSLGKLDQKELHNNCFLFFISFGYNL